MHQAALPVRRNIRLPVKPIGTVRRQTAMFAISDAYIPDLCGSANSDYITYVRTFSSRGGQDPWADRCCAGGSTLRVRARQHAPHRADFICITYVYLSECGCMWLLHRPVNTYILVYLSTYLSMSLLAPGPFQEIMKYI